MTFFILAFKASFLWARLVWFSIQVNKSHDLAQSISSGSSNGYGRQAAYRQPPPSTPYLSLVWLYGCCQYEPARWCCYECFQMKTFPLPIKADNACA